MHPVRDGVMQLPQPPRLAQFWLDNGWLPLTLLAVVLIGAPLTGTFLWLEGQQRSAEHARYGITIATQLASAAEEPLLADDRIALSLLVRRTSEHNGVASSAIYSADDNLIVAGDQARTSPREREGGDLVYQAPIRLEGTIAGYSRIALQPAGTRLPAALLFVLAGGALLLGYVAWLLHRLLDTRLQPVRQLYEEQQQRSASASHNLGALLELTAPIPEPATQATDDHPAVQPAATEYGLVVNVFNQLSLAVHARRASIDGCLQALEPVCRRYGATAERLRQTGILLRLNGIPQGHPATGDEALVAIHAALEAQQALHGYNQQRREQGEPELVLRLGLEMLQPDPESGDISASVARGITLSALARDQGVAITDQVLYGCKSPSQLDYVTLKSAALRALGSSSQAWLVKGLTGDRADSTSQQGTG